MKTLEEISEAGLTVVRHGIDRALINDFQDEWLTHLARTGQTRVMRKAGIGEPIFFSDGFDVDVITEQPDLPATAKVIELLSLLTEEYAYNFTINYQPPNIAQDFHKDNKTDDDTVIIVHGGDHGAFDYSVDAQTPEEAEATHLTIEFEAGDILYHKNPYIFHRGRNMSSVPRVTAAIARIVEGDYFDSQR